jgi:hypothetical protein
MKYDYFSVTEHFKDIGVLMIFHTAMVAYLSDILTRLNDLNLSIQFGDEALFKLKMRRNYYDYEIGHGQNVSERRFESFPTLGDVLTTFDGDLSQEIGNLTIQHSQSLKNNCRVYFPLPDVNNKCIRDLFHVDVKKLTESGENSPVKLSYTPC